MDTLEVDLVGGYPSPADDRSCGSNSRLLLATCLAADRIWYSLIAKNAASLLHSIRCPTTTTLSQSSEALCSSGGEGGEGDEVGGRQGFTGASILFGVDRGGVPIDDPASTPPTAPAAVAPARTADGLGLGVLELR